MGEKKTFQSRKPETHVGVFEECPKPDANMMIRLRSRAELVLTVLVTVGVSLVIVVYFFLGAVINDNSPVNKLPLHSKENEVYESEFTARPWRNAKNLDRQIDDRNNVDPGDNDAPLFQGHKVVHLDLKGAPFKVSYYSYLFPLLKDLGATGVIIEYEDMFPYSDNLGNIPAGNCYSKGDITMIQKIAKDNGLMVIPLIQTFGHLEFVLKLEQYKDFREVPSYPQALCPSNDKSMQLIRSMVDQVMALHPTVEYLHIGADEVYQIGVCSRCQETLIKNMWTKKQLFLDHVVKVANYIKKTYPQITVLMWDDEFRDIEPQDIINRGIDTLVEPVVWKYTTDPGSSLTEQLWKNYMLVWKNVWVATAFKGATAPDSYYTDISYHVENHQRWLEIINTYSGLINFKGVILTGWQRYDHFSVLCELLPVALPSLAVNLAVLKAPDLSDFPIEVPGSILRKLQCDSPVSLSVAEPQYAWTKCEYLGALVYAETLRLFALNQEVNKMEQDNTFKGWLKPYNIKYGFSSPSYVDRATTDLDRLRMEIVYVEKEMRAAMSGIYDNYTVQEWVETFLAPVFNKVNLYWEAKEKLLAKTSWPRRPLTKVEL